MFIDTHAHINDDKLIDDIQNVIERAHNENVDIIINSGSSYSSSKSSIEIANKFKEVYACIGIHPENCEEYNDEVEKFIIDNADNKKVVAIGEIGLDYHYEGYNCDLQKKVFIKQLELAHKYNLPVVIHSRDATKDMIEILKEYKSLLTNGGLMHCFNGSVETLNEILKLGLKVSFGGIVTFKNARNSSSLITQIPIDSFTLETDCPYLCPEPFRGNLNEPKNIPLIAKKIADILGLNIKEIEEITTKNAKNLFKKLI